MPCLCIRFRRAFYVSRSTISLSFAAFHLSHLLSPSQVTTYDIRDNLEGYVQTILPEFYGERSVPITLSKIKIARSVGEAVQNAHIMYASGLENLETKREMWAEVEKYAPRGAPLWSSTSGISASPRPLDMENKPRVLVAVYRFISRKKLLDLSQPSSPLPCCVKSYIPLNEGVVTVKEVDEIVQSSVGPRWTVAGPFKSYHAGGGSGSLERFFRNIGGTVQACRMDSGHVNVWDGLEENFFREAKEEYGIVDLKERDAITRKLLDVVEVEKAKRKKLGEN
ncbi:hypothetical protein K469DRAFT_733944 [Zopfia rhizophila CBS 207.26]|uniref:3-hydroxyacyl-CoA dehydrogenase NAD binding domain-containing protein n=1 Tax=Zopfia rhizophila CBS 207.26 TaxID=1314779 RepID=A0A6A6EWA8_9PEZI|nr:hypothetical protein K469DRAFT_733944 [Zopfia rhizophila CBS 207.26]